MFPGGVPGGAALPSPSAYSNPAATQFGVSLRKLIRKFPQIFSQIKKSNLACNKVCLGSIFKNIFPKFLKGENRAKKPTGSENFLSDFEPLQFFQKMFQNTRIARNLSADKIRHFLTFRPLILYKLYIFKLKQYIFILDVYFSFRISDSHSTEAFRLETVYRNLLGLMGQQGDLTLPPRTLPRPPTPISLRRYFARPR